MRSFVPATREAAGVPSAWSQPLNPPPERPRRWDDAGSPKADQKAGAERTGAHLDMLGSPSGWRLDETTAVAACCSFCSWCFPLGAEEMVIVPREVLDGIVERGARTRCLDTRRRKSWPCRRSSCRKALLAPPAGDVDCPPEYAHNEGLLIRWGSFNDVLTAMTVPITTGDPDGIVYIVVWSASHAEQRDDHADQRRRRHEPGRVHHRRHRLGVDPRLRPAVHLRGRPTGPSSTTPTTAPRPIGQPDSRLHRRALGRSRRTTSVFDHGGGNFHLFGDDEAFMTELIVNENPTLTPAEIEQRYLDYQGLDLTITDPLPSWFDSTQHIDMWMLPVADREVIIGEYDRRATGRQHRHRDLGHRTDEPRLHRPPHAGLEFGRHPLHLHQRGHLQRHRLRPRVLGLRHRECPGGGGFPDRVSRARPSSRSTAPRSSLRRGHPLHRHARARGRSAALRRWLRGWDDRRLERRGAVAIRRTNCGGASDAPRIITGDQRQGQRQTSRMTLGDSEL